MWILKIGYSVAISADAFLVVNDRTKSVELAFRSKSRAHGPDAILRGLYGGSNGTAIAGLDEKFLVNIQDPQNVEPYSQIREEYEAVRRNFIDDDSFGRFLDLAQPYERDHPQVAISESFTNGSLKRFFQSFEPEFGVEKSRDSEEAQLVCTDSLSDVPASNWLCLQLTDEYIRIGNSRLMQGSAKSFPAHQTARDLSTAESHFLTFFINKLLFAELFSLNELNSAVVYSTARQYIEFNRTNLAVFMHDYGGEVLR